MTNKSEIKNSKPLILAGLGALLAAFCFLPSFFTAAPPNVQPRPLGVVVDSPTIAIATAAATTSSTPSSAAREAHVTWVFGTVSGTYSGCTAQAQTSYDGVNFQNLGGTAALTVTSGTQNTWDIYQQGPASTGVTVTTPGNPTGFGQLTNFKFACTGYGTSAPVTITTIYR